VALVGPEGELLWQFTAPLRAKRRWKISWKIREEEHLCGLGAHALSVDLRGTRRRLWNKDPIGGSYGPGSDPTYCAIPTLMGIGKGECVLAVFDQLNDGIVSVSQNGEVDLKCESETLSFYLGIGDMASLLRTLSTLGGGVALPPRWALGYAHARWGWPDQDAVYNVIHGFRENQIPVSSIYLDIDHLDGYRVFTHDPIRFPSLGSLSKALSESGTHLVTIVNPGIKVDSHQQTYSSGLEGDYFVKTAQGKNAHGIVWPGTVVYPDFLNTDATSWWSGFYDALCERGVSGVWHDMNEPTSLLAWGDRSLLRSSRHNIDGESRTHGEVHNLYALAMDDAGAKGLRNARPQRRPFILSRSGWLGVSRSAWLWSGDVETSWEGLALSVQTILSLGLSGVPFSGSDIGGFSEDPSPQLYIRWLELGIFSGLCRTHSAIWTKERAPWALPSPFGALAAHLIRLRYRLLPTLYTLAHEAAESGSPLLRPTLWKDKGGVALSTTWSENSFALGDQMVIAPVLSPTTQIQKVSVRPGIWYQWSPGNGPLSEVNPDVVERFEVIGDEFTVSTPMGQGGWLVRAGALLALDDGWCEEATLSLDHAVLLRSIHLFPDQYGNASGHLIDDTGEGWESMRCDRFTLTKNDDRWQLHWDVDGDFPLDGPTRFVLWGVSAQRVVADGEEIADVVTILSGESATIFSVAGIFREAVIN